MTTDPIASARTAISPVIDYEPPARASTPCRPAPPPVSAPPARQHRGHLPRRRPDRPSRNGLPPPLQSAAVFADAALRRVLEIMDGRRPPAHLRPLLAAGLAESVLSVRPSAASRAEPATLQRVRVRPAGSAEPATAVEAFGTYRRGRRTHALACRIEREPVSGTGTAWRIVALHIG
ncbi:Rv3235 family protein [[Mycobacterium] nativiensis]|uniref:Rv3235 family protein n=1 Tax=[Mycobacterium] nativiensis TaxID=2855503 RepID=A0ABU5XXM7_9MYCO|nr:Rv3235 family protein [Mycolicibacter sp. MYC340]MEB3032226.1 Rv3235 family protein [Mycolicibacter sp. MYC340]